MRPAVFVTGGAGYLGSRFLDAIQPADYERMICLFRGGNPGSREGCEWVRGDVVEPSTYQQHLDQCDTVLHMAAATGKRPNPTYARENTQGTQLLVESCRRAGIERFLHVSTIATSIPDTSDYPYAESKKEAERIVMKSGLRFTILRPTIIVGRRSPVLQGLTKLAAAPLLPVFGDGTAHVQPVAVQDVAEVMDTVLREGWFEDQVVEIGGPDVLEMKLFLRKIRSALGKAPAPAVRIPLWLVTPLLRPLERVFLPVLPVTRGQLKAFTSDGTARDHPYLERWHGRMQGIDEMLRLAVSHDS